MQAHFSWQLQPVAELLVCATAAVSVSAIPSPNREWVPGTKPGCDNCKKHGRQITDSLSFWLCKECFFGYKFSWCPWGSDDSSRFWLLISAICQISSCFVLSNRFIIPLFSFNRAHTKRVIQRCIPMQHLALVVYLAVAWSQCSAQSFLLVFTLLFFVGSTNSRGNSLMMCNSAFTPWCSSLSWQFLGVLSDIFSENLLF